VLALSATPIPRTLSMSLSGVRDLSLILTAPFERLAVRSYVSKFDEITITEAIKREIYGRKNSVYFVTPRKKDIPFIENFLKEKLPQIKYVVTHGQLASSILESRISKFYNQEVPLMVSTNIVENGLDLPHVNTIIVYRSNLFSLASLYQLKGRVGRSSKRGYAYITYKENELKDNGKKRLSIINSADSLGAGFNIASQDLDLRGGGSIIGEEQSGFIREIGTELYHQMLEEEILFQKQKISNDNLIKNIFQPTIKIPEEIYIPDNYIDDLDLRLSIYKRISSVNNNDELSSLIIELRDRFGSLPKQLNNLFSLIEIKILCIEYNIEQLEFSRKGIVIGFYKNNPKNPQKLLDLSINRHSKFTLRPDQKIFYDFMGQLNTSRFELSKKIINQIK
jgi:transcription-repair coupling factor (superfamily II helicase)